MTTFFHRFARPMLLAATVFLDGVSPAPTSAGAQSAEETIAFMLWGLEGGVKTKRLADNMWEAEGHNGDRSTFSILRLTDCRFRVSSQAQRADMFDMLDFDYLLDFSSVHDYSVWLANGSDRRMIVKIEGSSWYSKTVRRMATGRVLQNVSGGNVDAYVADGASAQRLRSAFEYFRSTFCQGHGP